MKLPITQNNNTQTKQILFLTLYILHFLPLLHCLPMKILVNLISSGGGIGRGSGALSASEHETEVSNFNFLQDKFVVNIIGK